MNAEEIRFDSDGNTLVGTYTEVDTPTAAALLITGSGPTDRDSNTPRLKFGLTKALAAALADAGVNSLRYDKRGVGASEGDAYRTGMRERVADARAAAAALAKRAPELPLIVIGHSEGALHAAEMGADDGVSGVVLIAMPARSGAETLTWQTKQLAPTMPKPVVALLRLFGTDVVGLQRKNMARVQASSADVIRLQGTKVNARWLREFMAYRPNEALARIHVPVLAVTGERDMQIPPADIEVMRELVPGPFDGEVLSGLSHLLIPDPDGLGPRGYRRLVRQPISQDALRVITDWITSRW